MGEGDKVEETGGGGDGGDLHDLEVSALAPGELAALTSPSLFGGGATVIAVLHAIEEAAA